MAWGEPDHVFQVGEEVAVIFSGFRAHISRKAKVTRVLKRYLELDDGSKWTPTGRQYPHSPGYHRQFLQLWTPEHTTSLEGRKLKGRVYAITEEIQRRFRACDWTGDAEDLEFCKAFLALPGVEKFVKEKAGSNS